MDREGGNKEKMRKCRKWISLHFLILSPFPHSRSISSPFPHCITYPACALRAQGLLLADGALTVSGKGEDFLSRQPDFFTKTAVTPERKVEKSILRWKMNRHSEGYKLVIDQNWGLMAKIGFFGQNRYFGPKKMSHFWGLAMFWPRLKIVVQRKKGPLPK